MNHDQNTLRSRLRWLLAGLTAVAYWQVSSNSFLDYDDPLFVTANPHVYTGLSLANLKWAFTTLSGGATSYQPLVWITHQLDCWLFGLKAGPQHLTNLWLHVANTLLLFTVLDKLTSKVWRSAAVAAFFALHPLHVQTVAWISERKSLLCALFWLLTTLAYLRYVRRGGARNYLLALLLFAAALLSKPIAVSLPFTLLLLDFWPLSRWQPLQGVAGTPESFPVHQSPAKPGRFRSAPASWRFRSGRGNANSRPPDGAGPSLGSLVLEKVPLFMLSAVTCWVTVLAQAELGAIQPLAEVPVGMRLANSVMACVLYLRKLVWPVDLAPIYPLRNNWAWWHVAGAASALLSISYLAIHLARKRPYLLVGWGWYLVTLFPTLGLVQVGLQGMADRYTYVPLTGIFVAVVWYVGERATEGRDKRGVVWIGFGGVLAAYVLCTFSNIRYWQNSRVLFEHAVHVTRNNFIAHRQLGMAYENEGDLPQAEREYRESLRIDPSRAPTHRRLGNVLFKEEDYGGALDQLSIALTLRPNDPQGHRSLAEFFMRSKDARFHDPRKALEHARLACELSHFRNRELAALLAQLYSENHDTQQAAEAAEKALALSISPQEIQGAKDLIASISRMASAKNEQLPVPSTDTP